MGLSRKVEASGSGIGGESGSGRIGGPSTSEGYMDIDGFSDLLIESDKQAELMADP